ncbi:magnesium transporter CorA family protein [Methanoplanus endosymbiosus]|uniref:Magnesium transporter CorA family protein n=1 Tax=Methanoplanus endosymbiosus TaxID=33865 RepID=A0A9E7PNN1_9EURY|nr:magnesium transporter CorA family protein [Methanoplanus endosymbiosus]UUX93593.1 magnesium transporter CorA family protein [Methanoplanus endosymbiosus]
MIEIIKTRKSEVTVKQEKITDIEEDCWIHLTGPSSDEISFVAGHTGVPEEYLYAALDEEERSRLEFEDEITLIVIDIPEETSETTPYEYSTLPLGIMVAGKYMITVCLRKNPLITGYLNDEYLKYSTFKRTRFLFLILYKNSLMYLRYLRILDRKSGAIEINLQKSMRNRELIQLLNIEKSLVFFSTSLKGNEGVLEKILKFRPLKMYEDDTDLLEDVIIENKQAIEMANIYSSILSGMMDAFASVINNNMNQVMKLLASVTIVIAIPNIIASLFGMNVPLPMSDNSAAFPLLMLLSFILSSVLVIVMWRKNFL